MANVRFQVSVKEGDIKGFFDRVTRLAGRRLRNNFGDLRPLVEATIDEQVEKRKNTFIPTNSEIGELGVGVGGSPDDRARTAWEGLKASEKNGVTVFSVRKKGSERGSIIGEITIEINEDVFYSLPESNIPTDSEELPVIPWMRWLIDGETISGFRFKGVSSPASRTGRGIMIKGGLWQFSGRGARVYSDILDRARIAINRKLKAEGASILRKLR